jgi:hypothetical protein
MSELEKSATKINEGVVLVDEMPTFAEFVRMMQEAHNKNKKKK